MKEIEAETAPRIWHNNLESVNWYFISNQSTQPNICHVADEISAKRKPTELDNGPIPILQ